MNQLTSGTSAFRFGAVIVFAHILGLAASAQSFVSSSRMLLGTESNKSASVRMGNLNGDEHLDIVVANGRHWPQQNYVFLNSGTSRFTQMRPLGTDRSTSYACEIADLDGDGDLDIVTGNDTAPCQIFLNDGEGKFSLKGNFGEISSVRSLTVYDIDGDKDQDILITCRGRANRIYLNDGNANFENSIPFGSRSDSTIDVAVGDVNNDGNLDLLLANRDAQPSCWILNDGRLSFSKVINFGSELQTRAVALGDFDNDGSLDWATGNIGSKNEIFFGDGAGGIKATVKFGQPDSRTYCLDAVDLDLDGDVDLIEGNVLQSNTVFLNQKKGSSFKSISFGNETHATYGLCVGDVNGDKLPDIVVANSDANNRVFLNRSRSNSGIEPANASIEPSESKSIAKTKQGRPQDKNPDQTFQQRAEYRTGNWPAFRGLGGRGVAEGHELASSWNADPAIGPDKNILWRRTVPGLGHSSPVIMGDKLFILTAVAKDGKAPLQVASGGKPTAADDNGTQDWLLLCYQTKTGESLWRRTLKTGKPRATRHAKATHANTSVFVAQDKLIVFLGSEGLYCYDLDGQVVWEKDLGVVNISKYGIGWGFASSPVVEDDRVVVLCDDPSNPYLACLNLDNGKEIWRTSRKGICERSWGTPLICPSDRGRQVVVNGWPKIVSYSLDDGSEIWKLKGGGDNPVPTPFEAHGLIYITNAHGGPSPIYAIRPSATGDLTQAVESSDQPMGNNSPVAWSIPRGGSYMSTPVVYRDQILSASTRGIVRSFRATTGESLFEGRLGSNAGIVASLVAGDGKIYCASENGTVYVLRFGPKLDVLSKNAMGAPCLASPAISKGTIFFRTTKELIAIRESDD